VARRSREHQGVLQRRPAVERLLVSMAILISYFGCIWTMNLAGESKAPQGRRTPKPGGCSSDCGQRASVLECGALRRFRWERALEIRAVHGEPPFVFSMHWDLEPLRIPLNRPPGTFCPTGGMCLARPGVGVHALACPINSCAAEQAKA
jgi:hypothetical protein